MIDMVGFGRNSAGGGGGGPAFPQSANLAGSWNLFGGDSNQVDASGNGNDLIPNNAPGQGIGPDGVNCADLDSSSDQRYGITHASQTNLSPGSADFAFSIFGLAETFSGHMHLLSKYENSGNGEYFVFYDSGADAFRFIVRSGGTNFTINNIVASPSIATWYCLQGYIDTSAQEIGARVNGGSFATTALTAAVDASTAPFTIGERGFTGVDGWNGRVAIAHVWRGAVPTVAEFDQVYNGGNGLRYNP